MDKAAVTKLFRNIPQLETRRLVLRRITREDRDDMFEYASLPCVTEYLLWDAHPDRRYTARYLSYLQSRYRAGDFYDWAVTDRVSGKMIGSCGFADIDFQNDSAEAGYVINPNYSGHGVATEALVEVIRFGFENLGLNRIEARFMLGNNASLRVMQKAGMTFEGEIRDALKLHGKFITVGICSILRREFYEKYRGMRTEYR